MSECECECECECEEDRGQRTESQRRRRRRRDHDEKRSTPHRDVGNKGFTVYLSLVNSFLYQFPIDFSSTKSMCGVESSCEVGVPGPRPHARGLCAEQRAAESLPRPNG